VEIPWRFGQGLERKAGIAAQKKVIAIFLMPFCS
jgi:hypothetical protein